jgi:ATP-dependent DNA helicase PIF1
MDDVPEVERLTITQRQVLHAVQGRNNVFFSGRAGCGKSEIIRCLVKCLRAQGTLHAVVAPTGIAAEQVGGVTLHSYMGLNEELDMAVCIQRAKRYKRKELSELQVLIIDEVSMLSEETFMKMMQILRVFHPVALPVLVLVGDFLQLPPVQGTILLNSVTWNALTLTVILLPDCFRQDKGTPFLKALDEARMGCMSAESVALLQTRVGAEIECDGIEPTILMSHRNGVDDINKQRLQALVKDTGERMREFPAAVYHGSRDDRGVWTKCEDLYSDLPEGMDTLPYQLRGLDVTLPSQKDAWMDAASLVGSSTLVPVLKLAVGAQVVFVANIAPPGIVNGTRGVVHSFDCDDNPVVKLVNGGTVSVTPWQRTRSLDKKRENPCVVYEQLPLQLAWALTIHKSQGMTLDMAKLDLGKLFSFGQGYVCLSRLTCLEGMTLISFIPKGITADPAVVAWYKLKEEEEEQRKERASDDLVKAADAEEQRLQEAERAWAESLKADALEEEEMIRACEAEEARLKAEEEEEE